MRRGRPSDDYPRREFCSLVLGTVAERSLSLRVVEALSGVNRGTLSGILHGQRPCERKDRAAILRALGFGLEVQARYLLSASADVSEHERILLDASVSPHPLLHRAQDLMSRGQFAEAHHEFNNVFDMASAQGDGLLQADAATWLAWSHGELERFNDARRWTATSIRLIESNLRMGVEDIINSISVSQPLEDKSREAALVLSRALRYRGKILAVRIVHHMEFSWLPEAKEVFNQSLRLDESLQLMTELGHNLRWRAVVLSAEDGSQVRDVEDLLSASRECFPSGGSAEAVLVREQGVIRWQKSRLEKAADFLWDAKDRLASFADARALGPTFCVLSKIIIQNSGDPRQARRYALVAASFHPYGYVLEHCLEQIKKTAPLDRQRDIDDLLAGQKPFDIVHRVMARVALGPPNTAAQLVERNLARLGSALPTPARPPGLLTRPSDWKR
jgi:hypothetical protein